MAKKPAGRALSPAKTPADPARRVAQLDREILKLLQERARLTVEACKKSPIPGQPAAATCDFAAQREATEELVAHAQGPLSGDCIRAIFRELYSGTRALLGPLKVAYLGPQFSYSHLAALHRFGSGANLIPVATIAAVFEEVNRRQADYGLVPIENSTDGRIVDTLGMFARLPLQVCGEVQLHIHHFLLGKCRQEEVREVYSKPQAISQCRDWLAKHLPDARTFEMASTAAAARLAADKPGAAAIASPQAGQNYALEVIAAHIEDNPHNVTRFAVIGQHSGRRTGNDKTAMMFELPHRPGSLVDTIVIFKRNRLNLTWIESYPLPRARNEYLFFVELQGHESELRVRKALTALKAKTVRLEVLGSYAVAEPVD